MFYKTKTIFKPMKETKINISAFQCRDVFVYQGRMLLPNKPRCNILTLHCYRHTKCSIQAGCLLLLLESDFSCLRCWPIFVRKGCCYLYVTCFLSTLLNKQIFKFFLSFSWLLCSYHHLKCLELEWKLEFSETLTSSWVVVGFLIPALTPCIWLKSGVWHEIFQGQSYQTR